MRRLTLVPLLLSSPLLSGCLLSQRRVNEPIPIEGVDALLAGMSAADVVSRLGAPAQVVELGERTAYRFEFERTKETGLFLFVINVRNEETRSDRVWCFFDEDDRLTYVGSSLEADEVSHGLR